MKTLLAGTLILLILAIKAKAETYSICWDTTTLIVQEHGAFSADDAKNGRPFLDCTSIVRSNPILQNRADFIRRVQQTNSFELLSQASRDDIELKEKKTKIMERIGHLKYRYNLLILQAEEGFDVVASTTSLNYQINQLKDEYDQLP